MRKLHRCRIDAIVSRRANESDLNRFAVFGEGFQLDFCRLEAVTGYFNGDGAVTLLKKQLSGNELAKSEFSLFA